MNKWFRWERVRFERDPHMHLGPILTGPGFWRLVLLALGMFFALLWFCMPAAFAGEMLGGTLPPEQYDHPFRGTINIWRTESLQQTQDLANIKHLGIAFARHNATPGSPATHCEIFIVKDEILAQRHYSYEMVLRHELAHCNGWPADHPEQRIVWLTPLQAKAQMPKLPRETNYLNVQELIDGLKRQAAENLKPSRDVAPVVTEMSGAARVLPAGAFDARWWGSR